MRFFLSLLILSCFSLSSFGGDEPIKFGKIEMSNLKMKAYPLDSNASAVILCDYGVSRLEYVTDDFKLKFDRHIRIKILNEDGLKWANGEVTLYNSNGNSEKLFSLKAITYNLEGGKVIKSKMKNTSEFKEELDKNHDKIKFTLPDVRVGSIIEYSYQIVSDYIFNFQDWSFQSSIPTAWSEYRTVIPEYYDYQVITKGYLPFHVSSNEDIPTTISYTTKSRTGGTSFGNGAVKSNIQTRSIDLMENRKRWVVKDAPAFKNEPLMTSPNNFISQISYELAFVNWPNEPVKDIMGTWDKLNQQFLKSEYFGKAIYGSSFLKKEVEALNLSGLDENQKISVIYNHVQNKMTWNGKNRRSISSNLKSPYYDGTGSSAEINLTLTAMLVKAGIQAEGVLSSTRQHGYVLTSYPLTEQFNYALCKITFSNGNYLLVDATDKYLPISVLPKRCINSSGWVVSENNSGWVDIESKNKAVTKVSGDVNISEEGMLSGKLKMSFEGYAARDKREQVSKKGEDSYINSRIENLGWEVNELELENQSTYSSPFVELIDVEAFSMDDLLADIIYIQPKFSEFLSKNPFKSDSRNYPVDFPNPIEDVYYVNIEIPEGYKVEPLPEPFKMVLPNKGGSYSVQYSVVGSKINVYSKLKLNQRIFNPNEEYLYIQQFFNTVIAKENEQIVLKKSI